MINPVQLEFSLITHEIENTFVLQRAVDGYVNATAMCKAVGKNFADYQRLEVTKAFLVELSKELGLPIALSSEVKTLQTNKLTVGSMGIPTDLLIVTVTVGRNENRGTWVHPDVAINLGQWCSPKFAVAVTKWVREWTTGKSKIGLPYHIQRYMANMSEVPHTHFSMLNELTFALIGPLESRGYVMPDNMVPDISEGRMFCKWLRDEKGIETDVLPTYKHRYTDGRVVNAKLYPLALLAEFRLHFNEVWLPQRSMQYFRERSPEALPFLEPLLLNLSANSTSTLTTPALL